MRTVGSYVLLGELAAGGMASVHLGKLSGPAGFSRTVAIKRLHPQFAKDPEFVSMFLDEARLAARIRHPNVVPMLDVVAADGELFLVMDYVEGESLARLLKRCRKGGRVPLPVVSAVLSGSLRGLHAAHEVKGDMGEALELVHRDASPHNILVGTDGVARLADFGIAKAVGRLQTTREGRVKGKLPYMPPEQIRGLKLTRRADIYALGVVLWECLLAERLFSGDEGHVLERILLGTIPAPSTRDATIPEAFDRIVAKATARDPADRYETALAMAVALETAVRPAMAPEVAAWLETLAGNSLKVRAAKVVQELGRSEPGEISPILTPMNSLEVSIGSAGRSASGIGKANGARDVPPDATPTGATPPVASDAHVSSSMAPPDSAIPRRERSLLFTAGLVIVFALGGALIARGTSQRSTAPPLAATTGASAAAVQPQIEPPRAPEETVAPPKASDTDPPVADAAVEPIVQLDPVIKKSTVKAKTKPKPAPAKVDCTIPYVVDATGKRTYRRECLPKGR